MCLPALQASSVISTHGGCRYAALLGRCSRFGGGRARPDSGIRSDWTVRRQLSGGMPHFEAERRHRYNHSHSPGVHYWAHHGIATPHVNSWQRDW
jgi:hypothetical protein